MKKYLVDVYIPASGQHFDVYLPAGKSISEVTQLLTALTGPLSGGSYQGTVDAILMDAVSGNPFPRGQSVFNAGIRNASELILV